MSTFTLKPDWNTPSLGDDLPQVALFDVAGTLESLDLDAELYGTFAKAKNLYASIEHEPTAKASEKVQSLKAIAIVLQHIIAMQKEVYNLQRIKLLETNLIETLKAFPDIQGQFMEAYNASLEKLAQEEERA